MKPRKPTLTFNSFQSLKALPNIKPPPIPKSNGSGEIRPKEIIDPEEEERLFAEAMEGVKPISRDNCVQRALPEWSDEPLAISLEGKEDEAQVIYHLTALVETGEGFRIVDTPEYIEGTGYNIHPDIARRLHQGDFSIQTHLDLHGMKVEDARGVFERFLRWAVLTGKRGVLIIHGRGLSSPSEPILKTQVVHWLTRGPWRKWVIAFCSARLCDGGAGATYVLLRTRPFSKGQKFQVPKKRL